MMEMVLYQEEPRLCEPPPQLNWNVFQQSTSKRQKNITEDMLVMVETLHLVIEPLPEQLRQLKQHRNVSDLLRKVQCFADLLAPIKSFDSYGGVISRLQELETKVTHLSEVPEIKALDSRSDQVSVLPLMDLLMAVHFDCGSWETAETRLQRLTDLEKKAFKFLFDGYRVALGFQPEGHQSLKTLQNPGKCQEVIEELRQIIATLPTDEDSGFAIKTVGMVAKDACARCYALRLCAARLPYQRDLKESLDASLHGQSSTVGYVEIQIVCLRSQNAGIDG
ncbi:MAG: hypothetical protein Q9211_002630 [Gyalolechia sp. 1 TL-2023]